MRWGIAAAAALALAPAARADEAQKKTDAKGTSRHDNTDVIPSLYKANVAEIEAAKVAQKNGQAQGVKDFAKQMEKDHGEMKDALAKLAKSRNLKLDEDQAKKENQAHLDQMKGMKGAQFDQHFTAMMVSEHEKDLNDVKMALSQAKETGDHELSQVLENAKTKIEAHHRMAMDLDRNKGMDQRQGRRPSDRGASDTSGSSSTSPSSSGSTTSPPGTGSTISGSGDGSSSTTGGPSTGSTTGGSTGPSSGTQSK